MHILIINGSYHSNGMITGLTESFRQGVLKVNPQAQVTLIDLAGLDVKFCTGTAVCGKNDGKAIGACVQKDAMAGVLEQMLSCDMLVLASPIYWMSHNALTQRFMERCLPLMQFSPKGPKPRNRARNGKKGVVIVSTGCPYPLNMVMGFTRHAVKMMGGLCRLSGCAKVLTIRAGGMESIPKAKARFLKQAYELGSALAHLNA